jgi:hypothetical protein
MNETKGDAGLVAAVGEALHGPRWRLELARSLNVSSRTIRRWRLGDTPTPPYGWSKLERLLEKRGARIAQLLERVRAQHRNGDDV